MIRYHEDHTKKHEHLFGEMIESDHTKHANLPESVIVKPYPRDEDPSLPYDLNDGPSGVDSQVKGDKVKAVRGHGHMHEL